MDPKLRVLFGKSGLFFTIPYGVFGPRGRLQTPEPPPPLVTGLPKTFTLRGDPPEAGTPTAGTLKDGILKAGTIKNGTLKNGTPKADTLKAAGTLPKY